MLSVLAAVVGEGRVCGGKYSPLSLQGMPGSTKHETMGYKEYQFHTIEKRMRLQGKPVFIVFVIRYRRKVSVNSSTVPDEPSCSFAVQKTFRASKDGHEG